MPRRSRRTTKKQILAAYLNEVFYGQSRLRRTGRGADVLLHERRQAARCPGGAASRACRRPRRCTPRRASRTCARPPQRRPARDALDGRSQPASTQGRFGAPRLQLGSLYIAQRQPNFFGWAATQLVKRFGERRSRRRAAGADDARTAHAVRAPRGKLVLNPDDPAAAIVSIDPRPARCKRWSLPAERAAYRSSTSRRRLAHDGERLQADHPRHGAEPGRSVSRLLRPVVAHITDPACATNGTARGRPQLRRRDRGT